MYGLCILSGVDIAVILLIEKNVRILDNNLIILDLSSSSLSI
jgi:hypothetical protein